MNRHCGKVSLSTAAGIVLLLMTVILVAGLDPSHYSIPCGGNCGRIAAAEYAEFRISSADPSFELPDTSNQHVISNKKNKEKSVVLLRCGDFLRPGPPGRDLTVNTRFLNLDAKEIRDAARGISRSDNPVAAVENFVYRHITRKTVGIPLLPALYIYTNRAGDCTEHSVLTVALLRAMGIPARAVVGMVYAEAYEGMKNVFIYHMWVEAFYRDRWVLADSTRPGAGQAARYIAFTYHSLKTEAPLSYLKALSSIKNLSVEYLGAGKTP